MPGGDHIKKLQDADDIYELRVALDRTTWRISFWKPGGRVIILLTVFRKAREGVQRADVDRAIRSKKTCQAEHDMTITHHFEGTHDGRAQPVEDPPGRAPRGDR